VLRDADTPGFVDVLRADIARNAATRRARATIAREIRAGIDATIATSHEDPLAYVRARTAHFVLPPDARYDARCSRAMSQANYRPFAVYAIGRPADDVAAAYQGKDLRSLSGKQVYALMMQQANSPVGQAFDATIRFYRARGFETVGTVASTAALHWKGRTATHSPRSCIWVTPGRGSTPPAAGISATPPCSP
jgi:L-amino acid N-acyltransferase YncA